MFIRYLDWESVTVIWCINCVENLKVYNIYYLIIWKGFFQTKNLCCILFMGHKPEGHVLGVRNSFIKLTPVWEDLKYKWFNAFVTISADIKSPDRCLFFIFLSSILMCWCWFFFSSFIFVFTVLGCFKLYSCLGGHTTVDYMYACV